MLAAAAVVLGVVVASGDLRTDSEPRPNDVASLPAQLPSADGLPPLADGTMDAASAAYVVDGEVVVIDVRPQDEYDTAHLPYARSLPLPELSKRLAELPRDVEIVAYCRGPFCLMSDEAVALLKKRGYRARKSFDGVSEWRAAGLPVARPASS